MLICKHCGQPVDLSSARTTEDGDIICSSCVRDYYRKCESCSNYINLSANRRICKRCDEVVYTKSVNNYSIKPIPRFKGKKYSDNNTGRYFGIEMEFNRVSPDGAFSIFNELYKEKWIYNKHDGSIYSGVEIVTNPLDRYNIKQLMDKMSEGLELISKVKGYKENAGIHIHVNRKSIDTLDIYKLGYLLNYKSNNYDKRIIYYISGRNSKSTNYTDSYNYCKVGNIISKVGINQTLDRYQALNLENTNTIEFRIFKTTADAKQIEMYVDFVNDMIEFCHSHGLKNINIPTFISWELNKKDTNPLIIKRIKNFFKYNGKIEAIDNLYHVDISVLRGINVSKYKDIIDNLPRCCDVKDVMSLINAVKSGGNLDMLLTYGIKKFGNELSIKKVMETTLKKVLISNIMKGLKECA